MFSYITTTYLVTMMKRLRMSTVFPLGAILLVIFVFLQFYNQENNNLQSFINKYGGNISEETTEVDKIFDDWPKCKQNTSADNILGFNSLPGHIKDFLYYRHCRHFPMLLDVPEKCGGADNSADVFLFLVIKSSPENYERREVLRKTWAKERLHNGVWIRRIFISGTSETGYDKIRLNKLLKAEQNEYNDILQWDFNESFFNLTLKQILFLEWMDRNCPNANFLLNGDDDVFANTENMIEFLQGLSNDNGSKHLFTGYLFENGEPVRWYKSKYYVPVQIQKSNHFPPYCGGGGFLLSGYTASVIYNMSKSIELHPIDDVFMGMCLAKASLSPSYHMGVKTLGLNMPTKNVDDSDPCYLKELLLVHRFLPAQMYLMWNKIHDPNLKCSFQFDQNDR